MIFLELKMINDYKLVAHRGLHDISNPENSINAFKKAIDINMAIELDVRLTKDNVVIVFHDENLDRMTGINKYVKECYYNDIKDLKLNGTDCYIPTLKEVLELINGKVPLLIEIKNDNKIGVLEDNVLEILSSYNGKYAIQSFNPFVLIYIKNKNKNIMRGQLVCHNYKNISKIKAFILKNMFLNIISKPNFISYKINDVTDQIVKKYSKYPLFFWTVRNKEQYNKCVRFNGCCIFENYNEIFF
jgi:glycerophosphoryl diester phosphodiesterase